MRKTKVLLFLGILACISTLVGCPSNSEGYLDIDYYKIQEMLETLSKNYVGFGAALTEREWDADVAKRFTMMVGHFGLAEPPVMLHFLFSENNTLIAISVHEIDTDREYTREGIVYGDYHLINNEAHILYKEFLYNFMYSEEELIAFARWYMRENLLL